MAVIDGGNGATAPRAERSYDRYAEQALVKIFDDAALREHRTAFALARVGAAITYALLDVAQSLRAMRP